MKTRTQTNISSALLLWSFLLLVLAHLPLSAQVDVKAGNRQARQGDKFYEEEEYYLAAQVYKQALEKDAKDYYSAYMLGKSQMAYFDYDGALRSFQRVKTKEDYRKNYPLTDYWLGTLLKIDGQYEKASEAFETFIANFQPMSDNPEHQGKKEQAELELAGCKLALREFKKPARDYGFAILPPPVNTASAEFAPILFEHDSSIVITSSRKVGQNEEMDPRFGEVFTDNYRFEKTGLGDWREIRYDDNFDSLNTTLNDGAGVFNSSRTKFYFTSCFHEEVCRIYVSELINGQWSEKEELNENINMPGFYSKQPALSPNDDTLFFVSDRDGGKGMNDIWFSVLEGANEAWGPAQNLEEVNTPYIDMSPCYYQQDGVLFFASNGREGFGGLDIYMARVGDYSQIENAGLPFNSNRDDFYFSIGENLGYLSSNRQDGVGNDDIYQFSPVSKRSTLAAVESDSVKNYKSIRITGKLFHEEDYEPVAGISRYPSG